MERKTQIEEVDIYLMQEGWRAKVRLTSSLGEGDYSEHFDTLLAFAIKDPHATPDELKLMALDHFKSVFKDVAAVVEKASFDSLWSKG